jgi:hypothetical protein
MKLTMKLPEGWHDLSLEDRLKSLLETVGLPISDEQAKRAIEGMEDT